MVTCKSELSKFLLDYEIAEVLLIWELITEAETVIVETETDRHLLLRRSLYEIYQKLVIVIADFLFLTPDWFPCLIERSSLYTLYGKSVMERIDRLSILFRNGSICIVYKLLGLENTTEIKAKI